MQGQKIDIRSIERKVAWRVMPFILISYFISFLDRSNVGIASLTMNGDVGLSAQAYGFGAGLFSLAFVIFEIPSNYILYHVGARRWIARIMFTWGLVVIGSSLITGPNTFYLSRFLLGVSEAGLVPGVLFYMTGWFTKARFATYTGIFLFSAVIAPVIGNPIGALIMQMDGTLGLHGWQWLFVLEGIPAVILAVALYLWLPDDPKKVGWLTNEEKDLLTATLDREKIERESHRSDTMKSIWTNKNVWLLGAAAAFIYLGFSGMYIFLPQIIKTLGVTGTVSIGLLSSVPLFVLAIGGLVWVRHSDRTRERVWHVVIAGFVGFAGFALAAQASSPLVSMIGITIGAMGIGGAMFTLYAIPPLMLTGGAAAVGFALFNSLANLGNAFGPITVGFLRGWSTDFRLGLMAISLALLVTAVLAAALWRLPMLSRAAVAQHPAE
ncbi:MAG TPA: MFS transporter [Afipia sp.]